MKVIFLDIDGVLNSDRSCIALGGYPHPWPRESRDWHLFDPVAIALLGRVVRETGAVCVLSSSWRVLLEDLGELAERIGVPIIDRTRPTQGNEPRGEQIQDWLDAHSDVEQWAILDDSTDMLDHQMESFVRVPPGNGMTQMNYLELSTLLGDAK